MAGKNKPNVLFISIDDLNDWVGVLGGHPHARTPNLDRLAARGLLFENAHCAAPSCNPSRTATLTGVHPSQSGVYDNNQRWRPQLPDAVTLPQLFRRNGWTTLGCGKLFHVNDSKAWDVFEPELCSRPKDGGGTLPKKKDESPVDGLRFGPSRSGRDGVHSDERVADQVVKWLQKKHDRPVFVGCGFFNPHLPWEVPQRYFDRHPLSKLSLPEVPEDDLNDVPAAGRRMAHVELHRKIVKQHAWKRATQAYLAATSFADAQLGRVLEALATGPLAGNTIIVLWSDHGWSLGEKFHWKKKVLWEEATRVPLVLAGRGVPSGAVCRRAVSLLDVFPTLQELCGLPSPPQSLGGTSFAPLVTDPTQPWDHAVLTTEGRGNHAVRTERWRYIQYADGSEELYDRLRDPNEWTNVARSHPDTIAALQRWLPRSNAAPAPEETLRCTTG